MMPTVDGSLAKTVTLGLSCVRLSNVFYWKTAWKIHGYILYHVCFFNVNIQACTNQIHLPMYFLITDAIQFVIVYLVTFHYFALYLLGPINLWTCNKGRTRHSCHSKTLYIDMRQE